MTRDTATGSGSRETAKAERRAQLLESAKRLFARHGFRAVRLGDIGKGAGVSGPAVYRHFESKEAVLTELLVGISEHLHAGGAEIVSRNGAEFAPRSGAGPDVEVGTGADANSGADGTTGVPAPEAGSSTAAASAVLRRLIDFHVDFAMAQPELIRIQDRDLDALPGEARQRVRRLQRQYVTLWAEAARAAAPALTQDEATVRVHSVFGMVNSTPHLGRSLPRAMVSAQLRLTARAALEG